MKSAYLKACDASLLTFRKKLKIHYPLIKTMKPIRALRIIKQSQKLSLLLVFICVPDGAFGIETLDYDLVSQTNSLEIRAYKAHQLATVNIESGFTRAGFFAFRSLFKYISGENQEQKQIAMTAPVLQKPSEKGWSVSFVMPQSGTSGNMPVPKSSQIIREQIRPSLMAAITYSGSWRKSRFITHKEKLIKAIALTQYQIWGPIIWARYDPSFSLPFTRRNEIIANVCFQNPN